MSLAKQDYEQALLSQNACNASGLLSALGKEDGLRDRIWEDVRANGGGTDEFNKHPIVVLYVAQLAMLSGVAAIADVTAYGKAYDAVKDKIASWPDQGNVP